MKSRRAILSAIVVSVVLAVAAGCGDGNEGGPASIPTETIPAPATAATTANGVATLPAGTTGIAELDAVIDALRSGDSEQLRPLIGFTLLACSPEGQVISGKPECEGGESDGDLVEVFHYSACEGQDLRPNKLDQAMSVFASSSLYAVYRVAAGGSYSGDYVAVLADEDPDRARLAWAVEIDGGRITALRFSCAATPDEFVKHFAPEDVVLPAQN